MRKLIAFTLCACAVTSMGARAQSAGPGETRDDYVETCAGNSRGKVAYGYIKGIGPMAERAETIQVALQAEADSSLVTVQTLFYPVSTDNGKAIFSLLMLAYASDSPVYLNCNGGGNFVGAYVGHAA